MRRFAYVLLALIWIAGVWIWFQRERDAAPPTPLQPSVPALEATSSTAAKLEAPAARKSVAPRQRQRVADSSETIPLALVRVRSSVGLPLLWVEVSIAGEDWLEIDLPESGLEVEPAAYPLRVRAAGHVEVEAPRGAGEVVLEPDALLTIESPNLRTRARHLETLRGSNRSPRQSKTLAEFVDADHLLVAFSPARLAAFHPGDFDLAFVCPDGRPVEIRIRPIPGLRARYVLEPDDLRGLAPLDVEIVDEGERPGWVRLWLTQLGPAQPGVARDEFDWGSVAIGEWRPPDFPEPIWGRPSRARVEALGLGRSYALCALDENEHYGRIEFVHDGSARRIVLLTPFTIVGRAVDAENAAGLGWPDVRSHPLGKPEDPDWFARGGPSDEGGGFELHIPGSTWGRQRGLPPLEPPERFKVVVSAEGHRSAELEFDWNGRRRVDLGAIALARNPVSIAIDLNDLLLALSSGPRAFTFGDEPALEWTLARAIARSDGIQELELAPGGSASTALCRNLVSGERTELPFASRNHELLLLEVSNDAFAFRRDEGGTFQLVPRSLYPVAVQCESLPEGGAWTLGWRGVGTWAGFRSVSQRGQVAEWVLLPEIATELWWSAGEAPAELCKRAGGSLRLDGNRQTLVLR